MTEDMQKKLMVLGSIAVLIVLSMLVIWPIFLSIIAGLILAYIFYPIYTRVLGVVREKNISSLIIVLFLLFAIFIPLWFLFPIIVRQVFDAYAYSQKIDLISSLSSIFSTELSKDIISLLNNFISNSANSIFSSFSTLLLDIPNLLLQGLVIMIVLFFGMRDAETLKSYAKAISPFSKELENSLTNQFKGITSAVIYGQVVLGILKGILTGIGLYIAGMPNVLILTIIATISSVLPIIGPWLIWIPAVVYLLMVGKVGGAIFLLLYCAILVSWIDNILLPYIVARRANVSSGIVLVGMIGGIIMFGVMGFVLGPLILAYLVVLLDAYKNKKIDVFFSK